MKTVVAAAVAIVLLCGSSTYAQACNSGRCGVSVLAPGVSVQVQPPVFVPQIVLPQFQLQAQAAVVPQFQVQASAPLVVPQLGLSVIDFDPDNRVLIRRRNGTVQADIRGDVRSIRRGLFGRVKRIEFFD